MSKYKKGLIKIQIKSKKKHNKNKRKRKMNFSKQKKAQKIIWHYYKIMKMINLINY